MANQLITLDVVIQVAKALEGWDGSPEQAAVKLGQAIKAIESYAGIESIPSKIEGNDPAGARDRFITLLANECWPTNFVRDCFDHYDAVQGRLILDGIITKLKEIKI